MSSGNYRNGNLAPGPHNLECKRVVGTTPKSEIGLSITDAHTLDCNVVQKSRQSWVAQSQRGFMRIKFKPEAGGQQPEWHRTGPCLRGAGNRIERRATVPLSLEAAK